MGRPRVTRAIFTFGSAALAAGPPFADPPGIAVCRGPAATNSDTSNPIDPWTAPGRIDDGVTGLGILSGNAVGRTRPSSGIPPGPDHLRNRGRAARRPRGPGIAAGDVVAGGRVHASRRARHRITPNRRGVVRLSRHAGMRT